MSHSLTSKKGLKFQQSQEPSKQQQLLDKILSQQDNTECADCRAKSPQWASIDFGVIICMNCAGAHRTLSRQITRVKSIKLDNWTFDLIEIIQNIGNQIANNFFEYQVPSSYKKPSNNSSLEDLIKYVNDKYVKKMFVPQGLEDPVKQFKENGVVQKKQEFNQENDQKESSQQKSVENTTMIKPLSLGIKTEQQQIQQQNDKNNNQQNQNLNNSNNQNNLLDIEHTDEFEEFQQATVAVPVIQQSQLDYHNTDEFASYQTAEHLKINKNNEIVLNQAQQQLQHNINQYNYLLNQQQGAPQQQTNYNALNMFGNHQINQQQMIMRQQHQYQLYVQQQHQYASKVYQQNQLNMLQQNHYQKSGYLNNYQHF